MKKLIWLLFFSGFTIAALAQAPAFQLYSADDWVQSKNYYLLTLFEQGKEVNQLLAGDPVLSSLTQAKLNGLQNAINTCKDLGCAVQSMEFTESEIKQAGSRLAQLYKPGNALGKLVSTQLIPSSAYSLYKNISPAELLVKAWEQDAAGINYAIDVYAGGKKPRYPKIDSISFNVNRKSYQTLLYNARVALAGNLKGARLFFEPSLQAALLFLQLNGRQNPADYEPMAATVNKAAVNQVPHVQWSSYKYTVLLVPGEGPDDLATPLSAGGMLRCILAAQSYRQKLAPFIMVSGGRVHPYKTNYCEAQEMKTYLLHTLHIPESAIIMEPHARHTTTNMRNAARLIYKYHIPANKAALVVTDKSQHDYILNMANRCLNELKYIPYKLGNSISDTQVEFYPVREAFQINPDEPLDP